MRRLYASLLLCVSLATGCVRGEPRVLSESPDKRHFILIFNEQQMWELFAIHGPGDGSSVPGRLRLLSWSGDVLESAMVEMVSMVSDTDVTWTCDRVEIAHVASWPRR